VHIGVRIEVLIRPLASDEDIAAFRVLNEEWISEHFVLEAEDRRQLEDPVRAYIEPGGEILIAELDGRAVGCVAIVPDGTGAWELSKMAIAPELRGRGAGRRLLAATIARARELGARSLFLGSSTNLANAVHLYEALGFRHVPPETLHMPYDRADVFMQLVLEPAAAKLVGINHVALEVGDVDDALAWYRQFFAFELRGRAGPHMAFIDIGDQFLALSAPRRQPPDEDRHFGLVVDDKDAVRRALQAAGAEIVPARGLRFVDPWGNNVEVVQYDEVQFSKTDAVLAGIGLGGRGTGDADRPPTAA